MQYKNIKRNQFVTILKTSSDKKPFRSKIPNGFNQCSMKLRSCVSL